MVKFFLILLVIAALIFFGQRYYQQHPSGEGFWDKVGSHMDSQSPTPGVAGVDAQPTPVDHSMQGARASLRVLAQKTLQPLESTADFSPSGVASSLNDARQDTIGNQSDPDYNRTIQACALLEAALKERDGYYTRWLQDSAKAAITPRVALSTSSGLRLSGQRPATPTPQSTNSFFKGATERQWRERSDYYRPLLDRLLVN